MLDCRPNQRIAEELIVCGGCKNNLTVIAALDDVLRLTGDDVTGKASHGSFQKEWRRHKSGTKSIVTPFHRLLPS